MLTGGTYKGCLDNVLVELKLMVELVVVELDITDNLLFLPEIIFLVPCVSICHRLVYKPSANLAHRGYVSEKVHGGGR
jgi:hypothetical protein